MKKMIGLFICSWAILLAAIWSVYGFAQDVEPVMVPPVITGISCKDDSVVLTWEPVEYATSYSIHKRQGGGEWQLVKAVGSGKRTYTDEDAAAGQYEYSMRSCNVSLGVYHWSAFSAPVSAE